jgi:hypothetical protein
MEIRDRFFPGRDVAIVERDNGRRITASIIAAVSTTRLAFFSTDGFLVSARPVAAPSSRFAGWLTLTAVLALGPLATRRSRPFFTAGAFGLVTTALRRLVEAGSKSVVSCIFRFDESRFFRDRRAGISARFRSFPFVTTTTAAASSTATGTPFITRRRLAAEALLGVVEACCRRRGRLPESLAERVIFFHRRRGRFTRRLTLRLRPIMSATSACRPFFLTAARALAASGAILAGAALVTATLFLARPLFSMPTSLGVLGTTRGLFGAGLCSRLFGVGSALRATLGTLGTSATIATTISASPATAISAVTSSAGARTVAASSSAGGGFASGLFPVPALESAPELILRRVGRGRLSRLWLGRLRRRPRLFATRGTLRAWSTFPGRFLAARRRGLTLLTRGACRFRRRVDQSEPEVVVLRRLVADFARWRGPDDGLVFVRLRCRRFCNGSNRFGLDVEAFEVERIVVERGGGQSAGTAEEVVRERLPVVIGALFLKWIVHGVTLSLDRGEFKIGRFCGCRRS